MSALKEEMDLGVGQQLEKLERITPEAIAETHPNLPGAFLEKHRARLLDRGGDDYKEITQEYGKVRGRFLKSLVDNPTGYALALVAVGEDGVEQMQEGKLPRKKIGTYKDREGNRRPKYERYNCHHMFPKSVESLDTALDVNSPENFVVINTFRSQQNKENAHSYIHALILHPQTVGTAGDEIDFYSVKPAFPIYPPCTQPFESVEEVQKHLHKLDPEAFLPQEWAEKIVAFSQVCDHKPFEVPEEFRDITKAFGSVYQASGPEARIECAARAEEFTRQHLPEGATVRGQTLPPDHVPDCPVPIVDSDGNVTWPKGVKIKSNGEEVDKSHSLPDDIEEDESSSLKL